MVRRFAALPISDQIAILIVGRRFTTNEKLRAAMTEERRRLIREQADMVADAINRKILGEWQR
jgi:hypothetical protein